MPRNLDLTALRSFVAVADTGGVTRAAGVLNLTQSAVSMQLKRLEESLGVGLLDRSARAVGLTTAGEQLLGFARRMVETNDEAIARLTAEEFEGEIVLGVPHDIIYPAVPHVLKHFAAEYPRVKVQLLSSYTRKLKSLFADGKCDLIMTTEDQVDAGGETLTEQPLVWVGARGGSAWRDRPLRLAFESQCIFRRITQEALDREGIPWELSVEAGSVRTIEASVAADLAVTAQLLGTEAPQLAPVAHGGALPDLGSTRINIYLRDARSNRVAADMAEMVRAAYRIGATTTWAPAHRSGRIDYDSRAIQGMTEHA
ncbi:MAG: LysR family transcriptional regulator [Paracoccaceae bacterium]|nr:LysR family transcriptional regulator [Paracoccaceae bacterium]